ncbi:MAG: RagB/SusD family nutrient uptake outer membrane protein [Bacteroidales bacterium]|nr:RagB/SusD family nutrient uptake outer membrane protein [Bacteroidales bacterium]
MKTIKFILAIAGFFLLTTSCEGFLQADLKGQYTSESFFTSAGNAITATTGVYNSLYGSTLWIFGDVASDDAVKGGNAGDQADINDINDFSAKADNGILNTYWQNTYETIARANNVIAYVPGIEMDQTLGKRLVAEVKFLRAYAYFNLVNIFGEIPLKLDPQNTGETIYVGLSDVSSIYKQLEKDLREAESDLPIFHDLDKGRVTKGAALGLLAKVALYQKKYDECLNIIQTLEGLGKYTLEDNYEDLFQTGAEDSHEVIFGIRYVDDDQVSLGNHLNVWFAPSIEGGYYFNAPTQSFVDAFTEKTIEGTDDPRLDASIGRDGKPWFNNTVFSASWSEATGYLVKKYNEDMIPGKAKAQSVIPYHAIRYADILLMKAEALNETNQTQAAVTEVNKIRRRVQLSDLTSASQSVLRQIIRNERRKELGFEFHRFFDLMRWGREVAEAALAPNLKWTQPRFYFPIPQSEIDTNHAIQ